MRDDAIERISEMLSLADSDYKWAAQLMPRVDCCGLPLVWVQTEMACGKLGSRGTVVYYAWPNRSTVPDRPELR